MTQTWPTDDAFDHGTPVYGSKVLGYLGAQPESAGTDWVGPGAMIDGYDTGTCALVPKAGDASEGNDAMGVMRRQLFAEDQKVTLVTRLRPHAGILAQGHFKRAAVFVRIQGGTLLEASPEDAYYRNLSCYAFIAEHLTPTTIRFKISRYVAGVETILVTEDGSAAAEDFFHTDVTMSLEAVTNGAQVDLVARIMGVVVPPPSGLNPPIIAPGGSTGGLPTYSGTPGVGTTVPGMALSGRPGVRGPYVPPEVVDVLTHSDTDVARLTGSGRSGFAADRPRDQTGGNLTVGLVTVFQVEDLSGAAPVISWRDEFIRAAAALGAQVTDIHGVTGNDIGSDYSSDAHGQVADADMLARDTSQQNAEQTSALDFGKGIEFDGTTDHGIDHNNPDAVHLPWTSASQTELTVTCWANLHTNRDGHIVFGNLNALTPFEGFECAIGSGAAGNLKMRMRLGGAAALLTVNGDDFAELLNQRVFFAWTYKANANTPTGQGRVRFWYALSGAAVVAAGEIITISSSQRPVFNLSDPHYLGRDKNGAPSASTLMDGVLDHMSIFDAELTEAQLQDMADPLVDVDDGIALGLVHQLDFEEQIAGATNFYRPNYPVGISDVNSWEEQGSVDPAWVTGLKPTGVPLIHWAQRPATNPNMQVRSVRIQYDGALSIAGIILRGTPTAVNQIYTGYRMEVGPGTPARIEVFRVINGVAVKIAKQPASGAINVSTGIFTKLEFSVTQLPPSQNGPVLLLAEIDDVAVSFVTVGGSGSQIDQNSQLLDAGGDRILSGSVEGFLTATDTLPTLIDDWVEGAVVPPTPDPDGFPSLALGLESSVVVGSLDSIISAEYALIPTQSANRIEHEFDSGHAQRILLSAHARRSFNFSALLDGDGAEFAALVSFWDDHRGGEVAFNFDPSVFLPGVGPAGVFIFADDELEAPWENRHKRVGFSILETVNNAP